MRNEDCIAGMQKIRKKSVDLIITDPPFAIEFGARKANYNRKGSRVLQGYGEIAQSEYAKFTNSWMEQAYRTLKESGSMYVFSGWNHLGDILAGLDSAGFTVVKPSCMEVPVWSCHKAQVCYLALSLSVCVHR